MALYVDFEKLRECYGKPMPYYSIGKLLEDPENTAEIIRCKDCKHFLYEDEICIVREPQGHGVFVPADGFCNYAERRSEE